MNSTALIIGGAALLALLTSSGGRGATSGKGGKGSALPSAPPRPPQSEPPRDPSPPPAASAPAYAEVEQLQHQLNRYVKTFRYDGSEIQLDEDGLFGPSTARMYALIRDYHLDYCDLPPLEALTGTQTVGNVYSAPDLEAVTDARFDLTFCYEDSIDAWRAHGVAPKETY